MSFEELAVAEVLGLGVGMAIVILLFVIGFRSYTNRQIKRYINKQIDKRFADGGGGPGPERKSRKTEGGGGPGEPGG